MYGTHPWDLGNPLQSRDVCYDPKSVRHSPSLPYGLRWSGWYCNPEQHSLCRPVRPRRPAQLVLFRIAVPTTPAQTVSWSIPIISPFWFMHCPESEWVSIITAWHHLHFSELIRNSIKTPKRLNEDCLRYIHLPQPLLYIVEMPNVMYPAVQSTCFMGEWRAARKVWQTVVNNVVAKEASSRSTPSGDKNLVVLFLFKRWH